MAIYYLIEEQYILNTLRYTYNGKISLNDNIVEKLVFIRNDVIGAIFQHSDTKQLYARVFNDELVANMFI